MNYNPIGFITLYKKEVQRFTKIPLQTIAAPALTSLLFLIIFTTAIGSVRTDYPLDNFKNFLFPGLIMMTIIQNAFMNNSSSILMSKVELRIRHICYCLMSLKRKCTFKIKVINLETIIFRRNM